MSPGPIILDLQGLSLAKDEVSLVQHPLVGGVIFFSRNFQSPEQMLALVGSIRSCRPDLLLCVDQEGGRVQRFKTGLTRLPAMKKFLPLYRQNPQSSLKLVRDVAWLMASELQALGIDLSFAPVLDVDDNRSSVIADRAFSPDADEVVALAGAFIEGMHEAGMATTGKHFPGHGGVAADSHLEMPVDERSQTELLKRDLIPFVALRERLNAVMPAHILYSAIDGDYPAGFSRFWLQSYLRQQLAYDGLIVSDDLSMEGAAKYGSYVNRTELALRAGCDMVLICNNRPGVLSVLNELDCHQSSKSKRRIQAMFAKERPTLASIQALERWRLTRNILNCF